MIPLQFLWLKKIFFLKIDDNLQEKTIPALRKKNYFFKLFFPVSMIKTHLCKYRYMIYIFVISQKYLEKAF